jgi:hypothetical protein
LCLSRHSAATADTATRNKFMITPRHSNAVLQAARSGIARLSKLSAKRSLNHHLEHGFDCWCEGDFIGMHHAWTGAIRCLHVIRYANAITGNT